MELTFNGQIEPGYIKEVKDILENREFMQLGAFSHHQSTSRLMHSINVSYISWHIARKLGAMQEWPPGPDCFTISAFMISGKSLPQAASRPFIIPESRLGTARRSLGSVSARKARSFPICFLWGRCQRTGRRGSLTMADKICASMEYCHIYISPGAGPPGGGQPPTTDRSRT